MHSDNKKALLLVVLLLACSDSISGVSRLGDKKAGNTAEDGAITPEARSVAAFTQHLLPALQHCSSCHGQQQAPLFAVSDAAAAHRVLMEGNKVDFQNIPNSRLVRRLKDDQHNCVSDCQAEGDELIAAISAWKKARQDSAASALTTTALDPAGSRRLHYDIGDLVDNSYSKESISLQMDIEPLKDGGGYAVKNLQISTQHAVYLAGLKPLIDGAWNSLNASLAKVACAVRPPHSTLVSFENTTIFVTDMEAEHTLSFSFATVRAATAADADCDARSTSGDASIAAAKRNAYEQTMGEHFKSYCSCHPEYANSIGLAWKNRAVMTNRINSVGDDRVMPPTTHAAQMSDAIKKEMLDWLSD